MKFETRSGCKLFFLHNRSFGAVARIRLDTMSDPIGKLIGPAKTRLQRYVEEASSLPSSTVEEKIASRGSNCSY